MMTADLYIRVSTDEQAERGYSQRDQEERLRKYCVLQNITVRNVIYEDHSAKTFNRPQWIRFLDGLKKKKGEIDRILFIKWDRFSRNAGDAYQMINTLRKYGVEPHAVEQPLDLDIPENKIMLAFYLAAPEVENDRRALNTFNGMRRGRKEGRWMSGAPIGYVNKTTEDGKKYIAINEPKAAIIRWVFEQVAEGKLHVEQILKAAQLRGVRVTKSTMWRSLRNPVYCGKILVKAHKDEPDIHVKGNHEAIISEELFYDVQDFLNGKKKRSKRTTIFTSEDFILRGFLICPKCGKNLTASASVGRKNKLYPYYHCHYSCGTRFKSAFVNEAFADHLMKYAARPGMAILFQFVIKGLYQRDWAKKSEQQSHLTERLDALHEKMKRARGKFMMDEISKMEFAEFKKECDADIEKLENKLIQAAGRLEQIDTLLQQSIDNLMNLRYFFEKGSIDGRRRIIGSIFPEKFVFDGTDFRTTRENEVVRLVYSIDKGLDKKNTGQIDHNFELSRMVAGTGIEPVFAP
ncbi:recombinase family protein [Sediminibacterium roseum]|uniref:Recombinase family protein n=1 Tax=Sediminibacterium roseum TaxID=1978412 RepID=A0ABW9ZVY4_9BACT|nr:recombinase family protein [Sediminibacterium roseum]